MNFITFILSLKERRGQGTTSLFKTSKNRQIDRLKEKERAIKRDREGIFEREKRERGILRKTESEV